MPSIAQGTAVLDRILASAADHADTLQPLAALAAALL